MPDAVPLPPGYVHYQTPYGTGVYQEGTQPAGSVGIGGSVSGPSDDAISTYHRIQMANRLGITPAQLIALQSRSGAQTSAQYELSPAELAALQSKGGVAAPQPTQPTPEQLAKGVTIGGKKMTMEQAAQAASKGAQLYEGGDIRTAEQKMADYKAQQAPKTAADIRYEQAQEEFGSSQLAFERYGFGVPAVSPEMIIRESGKGYGEVAGTEYAMPLSRDVMGQFYEKVPEAVGKDLSGGLRREWFDSQGVTPQPTTTPSVGISNVFASKPKSYAEAFFGTAAGENVLATAPTPSEEIRYSSVATPIETGGIKLIRSDIAQQLGAGLRTAVTETEGQKLAKIIDVSATGAPTYSAPASDADPTRTFAFIKSELRYRSPEELYAQEQNLAYTPASIPSEDKARLVILEQQRIANFVSAYKPYIMAQGTEETKVAWKDITPTSIKAGQLASAKYLYQSQIQRTALPFFEKEIATKQFQPTYEELQAYKYIENPYYEGTATGAFKGLSESFKAYQQHKDQYKSFAEWRAAQLQWTPTTPEAQQKMADWYLKSEPERKMEVAMRYGTTLPGEAGSMITQLTQAQTETGIQHAAITTSIEGQEAARLKAEREGFSLRRTGESLKGLTGTDLGLIAHAANLEQYELRSRLRDEYGVPYDTSAQYTARIPGTIGNFGTFTLIGNFGTFTFSAPGGAQLGAILVKFPDYGATLRQGGETMFAMAMAPTAIAVAPVAYGYDVITGKQQLGVSEYLGAYGGAMKAVPYGQQVMEDPLGRTSSAIQLATIAGGSGVVTGIFGGVAKVTSPILNVMGRIAAPITSPVGKVLSPFLSPIGRAIGGVGAKVVSAPGFMPAAYVAGGSALVIGPEAYRSTQLAAKHGEDISQSGKYFRWENPVAAALPIAVMMSGAAVADKGLSPTPLTSEEAAKRGLPATESTPLSRTVEGGATGYSTELAWGYQPELGMGGAKLVQLGTKTSPKLWTPIVEGYDIAKVKFAAGDKSFEMIRIGGKDVLMRVSEPTAQTIATSPKGIFGDPTIWGTHTGVIQTTFKPGESSTGIISAERPVGGYTTRGIIKADGDKLVAYIKPQSRFIDAAGTDISSSTQMFVETSGGGWTAEVGANIDDATAQFNQMYGRTDQVTSNPYIVLKRADFLDMKIISPVKGTDLGRTGDIFFSRTQKISPPVNVNAMYEMNLQASKGGLKSAGVEPTWSQGIDEVGWMKVQRIPNQDISQQMTMFNVEPEPIVKTILTRRTYVSGDSARRVFTKTEYTYGAVGNELGVGSVEYGQDVLSITRTPISYTTTRSVMYSPIDIGSRGYSGYGVTTSRATVTPKGGTIEYLTGKGGATGELFNYRIVTSKMGTIPKSFQDIPVSAEQYLPRAWSTKPPSVDIPLPLGSTTSEIPISITGVPEGLVTITGGSAAKIAEGTAIDVIGLSVGTPTARLGTAATDTGAGGMQMLMKVSTSADETSVAITEAAQLTATKSFPQLQLTATQVQQFAVAPSDLAWAVATKSFPQLQLTNIAGPITLTIAKPQPQMELEAYKTAPQPEIYKVAPQAQAYKMAPHPQLTAEAYKAKEAIPKELEAYKVLPGPEAYKTFPGLELTAYKTLPQLEAYKTLPPLEATAQATATEFKSPMPELPTLKTYEFKSQFAPAPPPPLPMDIPFPPPPGFILPSLGGAGGGGAGFGGGGRADEYISAPKSLYADIISVGQSELEFGEGSSISLLKHPEAWAFETNLFGRVPTAEQAKKAKGLKGLSIKGFKGLL